MMMLRLLFVLLFSTAAFAQNVIDCTGAFAPSTSEQTLIAKFGKANVAREAIYVAEGMLVVGESQLGVGDLAVLAPGRTVEVLAGPDGAKAMLLGGATMDGPRHIWWNFVSSSKERIEKAKEDWREKRFAMVAGDPEFIPLPDR